MRKINFHIIPLQLLIKERVFLFIKGTWKDETLLIPEYSTYKGSHPTNEYSKLI